MVNIIREYSNVSKPCPLRLHKKKCILLIITINDLLNKWSELMSECRHEIKFIIGNYKANDNLIVGYLHVIYDKNI